MKKWYMDVRKTPTAYRLTLPLEHTFFLSARELVMIHDWCASHLEELESEASREEQIEAKVLSGEYSGPEEGEKRMP